MSIINNQGKKLDPLDKSAADEFLANGGKVTVCEPFARTPDLNMSQWRRKPGRPKKADAERNEE